MLLWVWGADHVLGWDHGSHHLDVPIRCSDTVAFWYQDSICSSRVSKIGVAVGVPMTVLVIAVVIFTVFLVRARRQKEEHR